MTFEQEHSSHRPSVPPTAVDATEPHHRLNPWAALILAAGAVVLAAPVLVGHRDLDQPQPTPLGVPQPASKPLALQSSRAPEVNAPIFEQFFQLDEVLITGADNKVDLPEDKAAERLFDRSSALSVIRTIGACLAECGPGAVGSMNVVVTFASSGAATNAVLEDGPLQGTPEGSCVTRHLRDARVPAFGGEQETVRTALVIGQ
jgi:hypothetical protein